MKLHVFLIILSCLMGSTLCLAGNAEEKTIIVKDEDPPIDDTLKPRAPAKRNVEAWLDGTVMTVVFKAPEGEATLTLETSDGFTSEEMTYSTDAPIIVDLGPFGEVTSFTIATSAGRSYIGYIY